LKWLTLVWIDVRRTTETLDTPDPAESRERLDSLT